MQAKAGDGVTLAQQGGVLAITFDVVVDQPHRVGHQVLTRGSFRLLLKEPIPLNPDEVRILFECAGLDSTAVLSPVIQDSAGEQLIYEPRASEVLQKGRWGHWYTHQFQASEAGGATQNVFESEGGDGNAWPDGKLTFIGFEARVYADNSRQKAGRKKGEFHLRQVEIGGVKLPATEPFVFADALFSAKGKYRVAVEVRNSYQGAPLKESTQDVEFDPADPLSAGRKLVFPVGAIHAAWLTCRVSDNAGKTVATHDWRWEKDLPPAPWQGPTVDVTKPPAIGYLRINPDGHTESVYRADEAVAVTVRVFPPRQDAALKLKWEFCAYGYSTSLAQGEEPVALAAGRAFTDVVVRPSLPPGRNAFRLNLTLTDAAGAALDTRDYTLGIAGVTPRKTRSGRMPDRDYVKRSAYFRMTFLAEPRSKSEDEEVARVAAMLDEVSSVTRYITYMIDLAEFEILPGVFDFAVLDRVMDEAADRGCALTVRLGHSQQNAPFTWTPYTRPRNFDGAIIPGHAYYGAYDQSDPEFVAVWYRAFKALHDRYGTHPAFQGYYVMMPGGEFIPDTPWEGLIAGYSWSSVLAFREYMQTQCEKSLENLNARWGTKLTDWSQVEPPLPEFALGKKPDLRQAWVDFGLFKRDMNDDWFPTVSRCIRTFAPKHVIIAYGGMKANGEADDRLLGTTDYLHNGGNHFLQGEGALVPAWDAGLGWITEPHHPHRWAAYGDPAERGWVLDWSVFVMTAQAGDGGANLHVYYHPKPSSLVGHYGGEFALDRFEKYRPILNELHGLKLIETIKQVAVLQDSLTLLTKHRTTFSPRLQDLSRWFELLKADAVDFEHYRAANEKNYKLLVLNPLDEVLSRESIELVDRMLKNGGCVVMSARNGRFCPDRPGEENILLKKLGLPEPSGVYAQTESGVKAGVTGENPFFPADAQVAFVTQADVAREVQTPGLEFMKWPYRWIPQSDYFGYCKDNRITTGQTLARFADGGTAISVHQVGTGKVLIFWGTLDMKPAQLKGVMAKVARWAGAVSPRAGSSIPLALEGDHRTLKRHYVLLYQETAGTYSPQLPGVPDGQWFVDDIVSDHRFGMCSGEELRTGRLELTFTAGASPLKILRMISESESKPSWTDKFRSPRESVPTK